MLKRFKSSSALCWVFKGILAIIMVSLLITGIAFASYSENINSGLSQNLLRLHVIANSDSPEDQQLKRDVRDVILDYMKKELKDFDNVEDAKLQVGKNLDKIKTLAENEIRRQNKDYSVKVMLGNFPFPTKMYGDIALPAGNYEALRVVIGEGEGQNWWCVMFPPLCFVDATHGTIPDSVKEELKSVLTKEEYSIVASVDMEDEIPIEIKFKIVEIFQGSRIKLKGAINRLFKTAHEKISAR
ncbi:stage II sporulation protein R [Acetivibrio clariflavus]|uniref:Stage II sporulation protein R n=1 Tax=Acetivibrio clariflavus (strain DSM 19732 / NBRC 101661 / EBR45) TaxID=720554 RepID=G8LTZ6_ACECE|nr:stage II sporulation protein R [Acetivibrio clariflavus]AEV67342.1 stage II sporulation protein R [Acetivibrio clariflavus DSM 19732]